MGAQVHVGEGFLYLPTAQGDTMGNADVMASRGPAVRELKSRWSKVLG